MFEQIRPWDTLACCWDVKQPTNKQTNMVIVPSLPPTSVQTWMLATAMCKTLLILQARVYCHHGFVVVTAVFLLLAVTLVVYVAVLSSSPPCQGVIGVVVVVVVVYVVMVMVE